MVRFIVLWKTPEDPAAFERHYHEVHIPLARQLPGLRRYTLARNARPIRGGEPYYMVAALEWDSMEALQHAFQTPEGQATGQDTAYMAGLSEVLSMVCDVEEVQIGA